MGKQCLWLVRMPPEMIAKIHEGICWLGDTARGAERGHHRILTAPSTRPCRTSSRGDAFGRKQQWFERFSLHLAEEDPLMVISNYSSSNSSNSSESKYATAAASMIVATATATSLNQSDDTAGGGGGRNIIRSRRIQRPRQQLYRDSSFAGYLVERGGAARRSKNSSGKQASKGEATTVMKNAEKEPS